MGFLKLVPLEERIVLDAAAASVIYVNTHATGANTGTSWADAYTDLQSALSQAASTTSPDQIWVASGTYTPTTSTDRNLSFNLPNNVSIYGGFTGSESSINQRNSSVNLTVLSGDIGVSGVNTDNSRTVVVANGVTALLDGLTISSGFNDSTAAQGGGMFITNGSLSNSISLNDMVFKDNYANGSVALVAGGGGLFAINPNELSTTLTLTVENSSFLLNRTDRAGAGIYALNVNVVVADSLFDHNTARLTGGALLFSNNNTLENTALINNSLFTDNNTTNGSAGALRNDDVTTTINNSSFIHNSATNPTGLTLGVGGAINTSASVIDNSLTIYNSLFQENSSNGFAGAINLLGTNTAVKSTLLIGQSEFLDNTAARYGGAIGASRNAAISIDHTDFSGNTASLDGGAIALVGISLTDRPVASFSLTHSTLDHNHAVGRGGAIFDNNALTSSMSHNFFDDNLADGSGGAIHFDDRAVLTSTSPFGFSRTISLGFNHFDHNSSPQGGAIAFYDHATLTASKITLNLDKSQFDDNAATQAGAIFLSGGIANITGNHFRNNNDSNGDEIVIDLPSTVNNQTTANGIINALTKENRQLSSSEIDLLP